MDDKEKLQTDNDVDSGGPTNETENANDSARPESATPDIDAPEETPESAEAAEPELTAGQWLMKNGPYVAIAAAVVAFLFSLGVERMLAIFNVAVALGLMIFVHELGHYWVAKWCGVKVEVFSIGFGPAIPGCRFKWGETWYKLAVFPLGGYVQMLGQVDLQEEDDPTDDDPRSYKNKPVWQRMAIISAGVIMNFLFAVLVFIIVFGGPGIDRLACVVTTMDSGAPSFEKGLRTAAVVEKVGDTSKPSFEDLMREVRAWHVSSLPVPLTFRTRDGKTQSVELLADANNVDGMPKIGVGLPQHARMLTPEKRLMPAHMESPTVPNSPAYHAEPGFEYEDRIIHVFDPKEPDQFKELPVDPRISEKDPHHKQRDYFEYQRRLHMLAGRDVVVRVIRKDGGDPVDVTVKAAFHRTLGAVMGMGEITAIRDGSQAAELLQKRDKKESLQGDLIQEVSVVDSDGKTIRWVLDPDAKEKDPKTTDKQMDKRRLNPERLRFDLQQWASQRLEAGDSKDDLQVALLVRRHKSVDTNPGDDQYDTKTIKLKWDDDWRFDLVLPMSPGSPMAVPELGLAYQISTTVVWADSKSKLQKEDVITKVQFHHVSNHEGDVTAGEEFDVSEDKQDFWAHPSMVIHGASLDSVTLTVDRKGESVELEIEPEDDKTWPRWQRGLMLQVDSRLKKADGIFDAVVMGFDESWKQLSAIFVVLRGMITRKVGARAVGGPIRIAKFAYDTASFNFWHFAVFIAIISINLAIVNFLPIPILDGGHMVFLTYELIRGKPAPESVRNASLFVGLFIILLIFVLVMYNDISSFF